MSGSRPGAVWRPFRMFGIARQELPEIREWSGGPPECPEMVGRLSRMLGNGREAIPDVWMWSGGPP